MNVLTSPTKCRVVFLPKYGILQYRFNYLPAVVPPRRTDPSLPADQGVAHGTRNPGLLIAFIRTADGLPNNAYEKNPTPPQVSF